ncbi:MAG: DHHA1 domain-containing protein, partial [Actinomycetota bacterium]|nr:DHHA1 domain-containing protein [Actinomycetota bacterium]
PGLTGHGVKVVAGEIRVGDEVQAEVDAGFRRGCERAHTATHILHWALRDRLGEHAKQAGSLVEPGRLRFDFNHFDALAHDQLEDLSGELQVRVGADDGVRAYETSYDYARSIGAMAIFGEKYGDFVRVVEVGEYSKELCGGTHVAHTSQIGVVVVTGESSVGANLRRVEALVGAEGLSFLESKLAVLTRAAAVLKTNPDEVAERVERLVTSHKELERQLAETEQRSIESDAASLAEEAQDLDGTRIVVARRDAGVDHLRKLAQLLKGRLGSAVVVLGTSGDGKANLVAALTKDLVSRGLSARELLKPGADLLGGGAGGKPDLSISGGPAAGKIDEALAAVADEARRSLTG